MREEIEAVRRRPAHEGAAPQPRRGDRHQPHAARRAEGRRGHRQPHPLRRGAEVDPRQAAPRPSASPRARARWRSASARSPRPPASRCTATRPPPARSSPRSTIGREIAPEHYRAVAAAIRFSERMRRAARARGGGMTPAALRRLAGLAEARRARDLARLDRLLTRDRALAAEIASLRTTLEARPRRRHPAAAGAAGPPPGLGRPAHPRRRAAARGARPRHRRRAAPRRCRASASTAPSRTSSTAASRTPASSASPAPSARPRRRRRTAV